MDIDELVIALRAGWLRIRVSFAIRASSFSSRPACLRFRGGQFRQVIIQPHRRHAQRGRHREPRLHQFRYGRRGQDHLHLHRRANADADYSTFQAIAVCRAFESETLGSVFHSRSNVFSSFTMKNRLNKGVVCLALLSFIAIAIPALGQGLPANTLLVPANPTSADLVKLSLKDTTCGGFNRYLGNPYRVSMVQNAITVSLGQQTNNPVPLCPIGPREDIALGQLPHARTSGSADVVLHLVERAHAAQHH